MSIVNEKIITNDKGEQLKDVEITTPTNSRSSDNLKHSKVDEILNV